MQINKNRQGLALGAVFSLVASLLVGTAPAQANEAAVIAYPTVGLETQTSILATEAYDLSFRFGTGVASGVRDGASQAGWGVIINKSAAVSVSATVLYSDSATDTTASDVADAATEFVVGFQSSLSPVLSISVPERTSTSAAVSITVTPFLNLDRDDARDNGEVLGTPMTLTFVPHSAMGAVLTLEQPVAGDRGATASFVVTPGTINWSQLANNFTIEVTSTRDKASATASAAVSFVELIRPAAVTATTSGGVVTKANNYSVSAKLTTAPFTTSTRIESVSAVVKYGTVEITPVTTYAVQALAVAGISISAVAGVNATDETSAGAAIARMNSAVTVNAFAYTSSSITTSINVARAITVSAIASMEFDADSGVILNGTTYTSSATFLAAGFTLAAGTNTFVVSTFGQAHDGTDTITLTAENGLVSEDLVLTWDAAELTVVYVPTTVAGLAGASKTFALSVNDQFGVATARTDLRVSTTVALGGSTSDAVTANVAAGAATVTVAPVPSTRTGSATVTFALQRFDQDIQSWVAFGTNDSATWNVFSYAAGSDSITSRTASISASISYGVDLSWSATAISVVVANSFSDVVVSAPGLMIRNADETISTASDTLTVAANGKTARFEFTSRTAGTYTVTFTNGTTTTTSQVVVNPARDADGATITFDTTAIAAGSTKVITGTLVDANGNAVNTSGSATILVTYTVTGNAGIPIGTMPTETDADGKFTITVLTGANDSGTAVVSATYYKSGASTPVAQVLTFNQSIVVGGAAAAPASDQKLTVGSFKGFVAIYALNYTGQKLSAKVAGKWLVVDGLSKFQRVVRNTGAGFTIKVDLYIDGAFVRSETVVTK